MYCSVMARDLSQHLPCTTHKHMSNTSTSGCGDTASHQCISRNDCASSFSDDERGVVSRRASSAIFLLQHTHTLRECKHEHHPKRTPQTSSKRLTAIMMSARVESAAVFRPARSAADRKTSQSTTAAIHERDDNKPREA